MSKDEPKQFDEIVKPSPTEKTSLPVEASRILSNSASFNKFRNDLNDGQIKVIRELAPMKSFSIEINGETKTFQRKKIKAREFAALEKLRGRMLKQVRDDPESAADTQEQIYLASAKAYLGMSEDEYQESDYEYVKQIVDTCNIVTVNGVPANPNST